MTHNHTQPAHSTHESPKAPVRPRAIALLNQKGGVGKTTSSVNLAAAFAEQGKQVCLIDLDPQAHVALHLGIDVDAAEHTVYDLLIDPDVEAIDTVVTARKNLDVLVSEVDLAGAETELATMPDRQRILRDKFEPIADCYDIVLIDCPPSLGQLTLNALTMVQEVFVPMQAHFLALQGVGKLLETVGLVCQSVNPKLRVGGIILCMHEGQTTLGKEVVADLDAFFEGESCVGTPWEGCRVLRPFIRRNIKLAEAPSFGQTIFDYAPWCKGALDYRKLASHIMLGIDGRDFYDEAGRPIFALNRPKRAAAVVSSDATLIDDDDQDQSDDDLHANDDATRSVNAGSEIEAKPEAMPVPSDVPGDSAAPSAEQQPADSPEHRGDAALDADEEFASPGNAVRDAEPPLIELIPIQPAPERPAESDSAADAPREVRGPISLLRFSADEPPAADAQQRHAQHGETRDWSPAGISVHGFGDEQ